MTEQFETTDIEYVKAVARKCAKCSRNYGDEHCKRCMFNPAHYVNERQAQLIRSAYVVWDEECIERQRGYTSTTSHKSDSNSFFTFIAFIFFIILIYYMYTSSALEVANRLASMKPKSVTTKTTKVSNFKQVEKDVQNVLYRVRDNIRDMNNDGVVNCQDYCLLFTQYMPAAQVIYNKYIGDTGHVFVRVHCDDGWLYIEPQHTTNFYARNAWYKDIYPQVKKYNEIVPREWMTQ